MNIYVSGLSYNMTDSNLKDLFAEFGEISSAKIIMDRYTGKSRGFGFVEMPNNAEGEKAISDLNGVTLDGKTISVNVAREREERSDRRSGGGYNNDRRGGFNNNNSRRY